jgi:threonine synthase
MAPTSVSAPSRWPGLINQYRAYLPVSADTPVVTLNEGNTPLVASRRLHARLQLLQRRDRRAQGAGCR